LDIARYASKQKLEAQKLVGDLLTIDSIAAIGDRCTQALDFGHIDDIGGITALGKIEQMTRGRAYFNGATLVSSRCD
jgi:phage terminase large subunit-like protein